MKKSSLEMNLPAPLAGRFRNRDFSLRLLTSLIIVSCVLVIAGTASALTNEASFVAGYNYFNQRNYDDAITNLENAVKLDPNNNAAHFFLGKSYYLTGNYDKAAAELNKVLELMVTNQDAEAILSSIANINKTITLNLKNAEIAEVLRNFGSEMGLNIITGANVSGRITVKIKDLPMGEALQSIAKASGLRYKRIGNTVYINTDEDSPSHIIDSNISQTSRTFVLNYIAPDDVSETLKNLVTPDTKILTTKGSNSIVVEGSAEIINKISKIINKIDSAPKEVMVEASIIEVNFNTIANLGINLGYTSPVNANEKTQTLGLANPSTATSATGLFYSVTRTNASALMEALKKETDYNLLASPKVIALNNHQAEIIMGQKLGYKVKTVTTTGVVESVEFLDVGTKLVFTPSIKDDKNIIMQIHPEISEGSIVDGLPQKNSTETTTKVVVKDGDTIIIGGLVRSKEQKVNKGVPFFQDIPLIGTFFRRTDIEIQKRELVIFITPTIVRKDFIQAAPAEISRIKKETKKINPSLIY